MTSMQKSSFWSLIWETIPQIYPERATVSATWFQKNSGNNNVTYVLKRNRTKCYLFITICHFFNYSINVWNYFFKLKEFKMGFGLNKGNLQRPWET
jgi:hypothetical protein